VAAGDPCQDCGQEGHQFHLRASKVPGTNCYAGPDAAHLEELIRGGMKRNSPEALEHAHELDRVLVLRRAVPPRKGDTCPNCKEPLSFNEKGRPDLACKCGVRAWFPEFIPPSPDTVRRRLAADLRGGPSAQLEREKQLARNDQAELQAALSNSMDKLADSIAQGVERALNNANNGSGKKA
jgi:hypothetical protein